MSEISYLDGPVLKPLFKLLHKSYLGTGLVWIALKAVERIGNGAHPHGRHGQRIKWTSFKRLILTGQSHLDAAWRWRTKQGIIKARATIKKALEHIDDVPGFTFTQPSPQYYQWMKDYYPNLYAKIKKGVKDGRFILFGGSWVESDTNIPSGEALVRQRLYGQRFYLKEFGKMTDVEFLQDCFGFNWNLPQIYKKSGARIFGTGKLFWNKTTKIPIGMCHWESPDGTKLPMIHIHFGYFIPMNYGKEYPLIYLLGKPGKQLVASYQTPAKVFAEWRSREYMLENVFGYGLGDGGHGPIEFEIAVVKILKRLYPKIFKYHQEGDFYAIFKKYFPRWATWRDEWYLDFHRGTYTSVARVKRGNRECENQLEELEKSLAIAQLYGYKFPQEGLEKAWKITLYNQFHDILPGSSIPEVYNDYDLDYRQVMNFIYTQSEKVQRHLIKYLPIDQQKGKPIIIFNPLSWNRLGLIEVDIGSNSSGALRDRNGAILPSIIFPKRWGTLTPNDTEYIICAALKEAIPGSGCDVFYYDREAQPPQIALSHSVSVKPMKKDGAERVLLSNGLVDVEIDMQTGLIIQIHSVQLDKNALASPSNQILIFKELKGTDAWNIDRDYASNPVEYDLKANTLRWIEESPLRATLEIRRKILNSEFVQRISLAYSSPVVHLSMDIDFKDPELLVKLAFNTLVQTNNVTAEIPYAYIDRTINGTTVIDKARWEHACQKFISINDQNLGITLSNNGKYGYNAITSPSNHVCLRPTVVRSPKYTGYAKEAMFVNRAPDGGMDPTMPKFTDLEVHRDIQYGFQIHADDWRQDGWKESYNLNHPLKSIMLDTNLEINNEESRNRLEVPFSLFQINSQSVQCGAFKPSEDDPKNYILRLIERAGKPEKLMVKFHPSLQIKAVQIVDLVELDIQSAPGIAVQNGSATIPIQPYEILTLKLVC